MKCAEGPPGNAAVDLNDALDAAEHAGDTWRHRRLLGLYFDFLSEELATMSREDLEAFLGAQPVWRWEGSCAVFKNGRDPCVVYTVLEFSTGIRILALGFSGPDTISDDEWWRDVILPRLRHYL